MKWETVGSIGCWWIISPLVIIPSAVLLTLSWPLLRVSLPVTNQSLYFPVHPLCLSVLLDPVPVHYPTSLHNDPRVLPEPVASLRASHCSPVFYLLDNGKREDAWQIGGLVIDICLCYVFIIYCVFVDMNGTRTVEMILTLDRSVGQCMLFQLPHCEQPPTNTSHLLTEQCAYPSGSQTGVCVPWGASLCSMKPYTIA